MYPQTLRGRSLVLVYESVPHSPLQDSHIPQIIHTDGHQTYEGEKEKD
jgi:hypothetical protein